MKIGYQYIEAREFPGDFGEYIRFEEEHKKKPERSLYRFYFDENGEIARTLVEEPESRYVFDDKTPEIITPYISERQSYIRDMKTGEIIGTITHFDMHGGGYLANWFLDNVLPDRFASGDTCPVSPKGSYLNFIPSVLFPSGNMKK